jgi:putative pyruvate formate lyase activating enzyme
MAHHGEEPPVSGSGGSGTVFFSGCTLACVYCLNHRFSQDGEGRDRSSAELARMLLSLEASGCHNANLVTPTHHLPAVLDALAIADEQGFRLPVVWNTSSYESPEALALLDGVVDIYLADLRYSLPGAARLGSGVDDYVEVSRAALRAMRDQVGTLTLDRDGVAARGLIVRHLVLPNGLAGTRDAMRFVAEELGRDTFVSLMAQYYPAHRASLVPELARPITAAEWDEAQEAVADAGLANGWAQDLPLGRSPIAGTEIAPDGAGGGPGGRQTC